MTLPVPSEMTASVGQFLAAADWNSNVRDAVNFLANPPLAVIYQTTAQSLANGATASMLFDTSLVDTYNGHSVTTNNDKYYAQVAGWYLAVGVVCFNANTTGQRDAVILKNGGVSTPVYRQAAAAAQSGNTEVLTLGIVQMNVGDYIGCAGIQTSGGALATIGGASYFALFWMHA